MFPSSRNMKTLLLYATSLTLIIHMVLAAKTLKVGEPMKGQIKAALNEYDFYVLKIEGESVVDQKFNLVINVKQNKGEAEKRSDFSDVDIYVSKTNTQPKDPSTATWYSEKYGDDLITIGKEQVYKDDNFYIGVYCKEDCDFELTASLSESNEIFEGKVTSVIVPKKSQLFYTFNAKETEQITFAFISPKMRPFSVYITNQDKTPSSSNTMKLEPSWISGYSLDIFKGDPNYCGDCHYNILIQAHDEDADVRMVITYPASQVAMRSGEQIFDSVLYHKGKCYYMNLYNRRSDERGIINVVLFSGTIVLQVYGFQGNPNLKYDETFVPNDFTYEIASEKVIILNHQLLNALQALNMFSSSNILHFCIYGKENSSYMLETHLSSQTEELQRLNFLVMGQSIMSFIPSGQVTRYRLLDFSRDGNITITLDNVEGDSRLYGLFTNDFKRAYYNEQRIIAERSSLLQSFETFSGREIQIDNTDNVCHKALPEGTNLNDELKKLNCGLFVLIYCVKTSPQKDCVFRLRANTDKSAQMMVPRTNFFNILSKDDSNYYIINIDDTKIDSFSIVLSSISGETELKLKEYDYEANEYKEISSSISSYFLPNVIHFSKEKTNRKDLNGKYMIEVKAKTFSTYSIYYYTKGEVIIEKPGKENIEVELETGQIVEGVFAKTTKYRLYSYEVDGDTEYQEPSDIRFTLTKRNFRFSLYVFKDLKNFKLNTDKPAEEFISGYDWKSDYNNQIIIKKDDPKYSKTGPYYVVVARPSFDDSINPDFETFFLGVTDEFDEFVLFEGMQHGTTLNENYPSQSYWYTHPSLVDPFSLSINVFFGTINVYVDFQPINAARVKKDGEQYIHKVIGLSDSTLITITPEMIEENCKNLSMCPISIFIEKKSIMSAQYLLSPKSSAKKPVILTPGVITQNKMSVKETHYYIIEDFNAKRDGNVVVKFEEGNGEVYMNLSSELSITSSSFPTSSQYKFKGTDNYQGKILNVERDGSCKGQCKALLTVEGISLGSLTNYISYSIMYSNQVKYINQNSQIKQTIQSGESHYYTFYFDETAQSIYVSLYCSDGDADLYMNYGQTLPTFEKSDWHSSNPQMDFLTINKDDPVFLRQMRKYISGYYTILIYGYTNSTYTLFATSHPNKIIPISNNSPGTCQCKNVGETCNFRFDELMPYYQEKKKDISVVFSTNYVYGSGIMYVKLFKETDFDITNGFPSYNNHDYSNIQQNKRNFLKVDINKNNPLLTKNSMLLISVVCKEKSLFELNSAIITNSTYQYLDSRRQNLFYLEQSTVPTVLTFYYNQNKNVNYEIYTYTGSANIKVTQNYTERSSNGTILNKYNQIADFNIDPTKPYYNFIKNRSSSIGKNVYFQVTPYENIGFFVKLTYESEWTRVEVGKPSKYLISQTEFNGYFDMLEYYDDVLLSFRCDGSNYDIEAYVKKNVYIRKPAGIATEDKNPFKFSYPDKNTNDFKGKTNNNLKNLHFKILQEPREIYQENEVRVFFKVVLTGRPSKENLEKSITVMVSPSINKIKRFDASPLSLLFSNIEVEPQTTAIFDLKKIKKEDDIFVIELSSCAGQFGYAISKDITYFSERTQNVNYTTKESPGRITLTIYNAEQSNYYLSVWGTVEPFISEQRRKELVRPGDVEYMIYYYTIESNLYHRTKSESPILIPRQISRNEIEIKTGRLKAKDIYGNTQDVDNINFKTFVIEGNATRRLDSLCKITKLPPSKTIRSHYEYLEKRMVVRGLRTGVLYTINILMENAKTGEIFTFEPINVQLSFIQGISVVMVVFIVLLILGLVLGMLYFYKKYKKTKEILRYEQNDLRSLGSLPDVSAEMTSVPGDKVKYTTLTSEPQSI